MYPANFRENGESKAKKGEKLTDRERELVRAALKFPLDLDKAEVYGEGRLSARSELSGQPPQGENTSTSRSDIRSEKGDAMPPKPLPEHQVPPLPNTWTPKISVDHSKKGSTMPPKQPTKDSLPSQIRNHRAPPPRSYNTRDSFRDLKKRILSNAHAFYAHKYPKAERYDLITSSITPTNLASVQHRAALVVYPNPKKRDWILLSKSNACPTVEDTAFEVLYRAQEDMSGVIEGMEVGNAWVDDDSQPRKGKGKQMNSVEIHDVLTKGKATAPESSDAPGKTTSVPPISSKAKNDGSNVAVNHEDGEATVPRDKGKPSIPTPSAAPTTSNPISHPTAPSRTTASLETSGFHPPNALNFNPSLSTIPTAPLFQPSLQVPSQSLSDLHYQSASGATKRKSDTRDDEPLKKAKIEEKENREAEVDAHEGEKVKERGKKGEVEDGAVEGVELISPEEAADFASIFGGG